MIKNILYSLKVFTYISTILFGIFLTFGILRGPVNGIEIKSVQSASYNPVSASTSYASQPVEKQNLKIFIVHSYGKNHPCTGPQHAGITYRLKELEKFFHLQMRMIYMETKVLNSSPQRLQAVSSLTIRKVEEFEPDYVFTTGDNAFLHVGIPLSNRGYKIIASGINRPFSDYRKNYELFEDNIVVVEESVRLDPVFNLLDKARIKPNKFYILYDDSETSYYLMENYIQELSGKTKIHLQKIQYVSELREFLRSIQSDPEGIIVVSFQRLYSRDKGRYLTKDEVFPEFVSDNKKHLELAANPVFSQYGYAICCGPDFENMGRLSVDYFIEEIVKKNRPFSHMRITPIMSVSVNIKRLNSLNKYNIVGGGFRIINNVYEDYK